MLFIYIAELSEGVLVTPNDNGAVCVSCTIPADVNATECLFILHSFDYFTEIMILNVTNNDVTCLQNMLLYSGQQYFITSLRLHNGIVVLSTSSSVTITSEYDFILAILHIYNIHA